MNKAKKAKEPPRSADDLLSDAIDLGRKAYWQHVRDLSQQIRDAGKEGEFDDADGCDTYIRESLDGDGWVIYTHKAKFVLLCSENSGAYFDQFGDDGAATDGDIEWSRLAYCALEADVMEQLAAEGFSPSKPDSWKDE